MTFSANTLLRSGLAQFPRLHRDIRTYRRRRWHTTSKKAYIGKIIADAREGHDVMLRQLPENAISPGERRDIEHHAHTVWGSRKHAASLLQYRVYYGSFCDGWVPWSYYNEILVPSFNSPDLIGAKTMLGRFVPRDLAPDLAYLIRGCWSDPDNRPIAETDLIELIFADHDEVYVKTEMGGIGHGVFRHTRESFMAADLGALGNLSVQSPVRQHAFFDTLATKSVATLRVTTVKPFGQPARSPGSHLRTGVGDSRIVDVKNGIEVPIMDDDGTLCPYGSLFAGTPHWARATHYPDSGLELKTLQMPNFKAARDICERLHDTLPHLTIVGWDIVIDEKGEPKIIEINTKAPGFDGHQLGAGAHFSGFGWEDVWKQ